MFLDEEPHRVHPLLLMLRIPAPNPYGLFCTRNLIYWFLGRELYEIVGASQIEC